MEGLTVVEGVPYTETCVTTTAHIYSQKLGQEKSSSLEGLPSLVQAQE